MVATVIIGVLALIICECVRLSRLQREINRNAEVCENYRQQLKFDTHNGALYEALGDSCRQAGLLVEAKRAYQCALEAHNEAALLDQTRHKLVRIDQEIKERVSAISKGWMAKKRPASTRSIIYCSRCTVYNQIARRTCKNCGGLLPSDILYDVARDKEVILLGIQAIALLLALVIVKHYYDFLSAELQVTVFGIFLFLVRWRFLYLIENMRRNPF